MQAGLHKNKDISIAKARSKLYWVDLSHVLHAEKLQVDNQWPATTTLLDVAVNASSKCSQHFILDISRMGLWIPIYYMQR